VNVGERFAWVRAVIAAQPRPTLAEIAVATELAGYFNADKGAAWPAQQTMADGLRMDRRTIRRAIASLEANGFIARLRAGGPKTSAAYTLLMPVDGAVQRHQMAPYSAISGRPTAPSEGAVQRHEQVSRNDSAEKPYRAANARSPHGSRASGATKNRRQHQTALIKL
jgi:hypothetical protein